MMTVLVRPSTEIGQEPTQNWRHIDRAGIESEYGGGQRLYGQRTRSTLQKTAQRGKTCHMLDVSGQQELVNHVKHQQGLHAVIGKAFPGFRKRQISKALGMTKEGGVEG